MSENRQEAKSPKTHKLSQNRRKSRELALKAVYRGMVNASELNQVFSDMK